MGIRIKTEPNIKEKETIPGPGSYNLKGIQLGNKGTYVLSTLK
jgi:hypothetical protein